MFSKDKGIFYREAKGKNTKNEKHKTVKIFWRECRKIAPQKENR